MFYKQFKQPLLLIAVVLLTSCATLQQEINQFIKKPDITYQSIALSKVSAEEVVLSPTFNVHNRNMFSLPIDIIDYTFSLNNKTLLSGETEAIGTLPANNNKDVTLSLKLTQQSLASLQQLLFKEQKLDYEIAGKLNAMGLTIPFTKSDTLYVPDVKVAGIQIIDANFSQVNFILEMNINNKNDFELPLQSINYAVSSKGNALFKGALTSQKIAKGQSSIQLPLSINPNNLFTNSMGILLDPNLPLHFEISSPLFTESYDHSLNLSALFR